MNDQNFTREANVTTFDTYDKVFYVLLHAQATWTFLANAVVISAAKKYSVLQTSSSLLYLSLAVSDLLSSFTAVPFLLVQILQYGINQTAYKFACLIRMSFSNLSLQTSFGTLCVISLERCLAICYPLKHKLYASIENTTYVLVALWITAVLLFVVPVFAFGWRNFPDQAECNRSLFPRFYTPLQTVVISLLFVTMVCSYIRIWLMVRKRNKIFVAGKKETLRFQNEKRLTKTMFIILGIAFATYFFPTIIFSMKSKIFESKTIRNFANNLAILVMYSNSALDPLIYSLRNRRMKLAVQRFLTCGKPVKIHPVNVNVIQNVNTSVRTPAETGDTST